MFGFLIKKSFFDLWDNFLPAILVNLGFIAVLSLPILGPSAIAGLGVIPSLIVLAAGVVVLFVYVGGASGIALAVVDYRGLEWRLFVEALRSNMRTSVALGTLVMLHVALLMVALPVYTAMGNVMGVLALAILFWMSVIWWLGIQYVLPVRTRLTDRTGQVFKKSFILTLDNTLFTIGLALGATIITGLSFFTAFLIPGISGLIIWYQAALKLRLYKYDYLEANPDAKRNEIPWDSLLYEDRERVGKRTLRGMIFPWKE